jgi:phage baseplate assembly protein W
MPADAHLGTDVLLALHHQEWRPVYRLATFRRLLPPTAGEPRRRLDFATVGGRDDLGQAVVLRLLTPLGELAPLGHPDYGSRLGDLVGRENTAATRNLAKLFILEALARERRIAKVLSVDVTPAVGRRDVVDVEIAVQPAAASAPFTLGPFSLELQP